MQVVADSNDNVKIPAVKGLAFPALKPELGFCTAALRAASMFARVVHQDFIVPVGAGIDMVSLFMSPTGHDGTCSMVLPPVQDTGFAKGFKMILEDLLYNAWFHSIPGGSPGLISALHSFKSSNARFSPNSATISFHMEEFLLL